MRILFASGTPHLPQVRGGVEINTHELIQELVTLGHDPMVLAKLSLRTLGGLASAVAMAVARDPVWMDERLGYPVFRTRSPCGAVSALPKADVAVVQNGGMVAIAEGLRRIGVPSIAYLHGLEFETWARTPDSPSRLPFVSYVANSSFTAERFRRLHGLHPVVIPPIIRADTYRTITDRTAVTFINPASVKGVELAIEIARLLPDIPFRFVRGWPLGPRALIRLRRALRHVSNARLCPGESDMRKVYRTTRILLVPSQWEAETWGRVVSEAQVSGIPVIASSRGGLPESVGAGGMVVPHDAPAEIWAAAVRRLWNDPIAYEDMATAALNHSKRPALDPHRQIGQLMDTLTRAVEGDRRSGMTPAMA